MQYTYPYGKHMALTFSYDDGQCFDRRLVELFNKYGLKATFHLNSGKLGYSDEKSSFVEKEEIKNLYAGHEIACHGVYHKDPLLLTKQQILKEYWEDRETLEDLTGRLVQGLSYAYGRFNKTTKLVAEAAGLKYSRTVRSTHDFRIPSDFMEWDPTCHHNDQRLMELGNDLLNSPAHREMPLMYVWGHSYEFDRDNTWDMMEDFCKLMAGHDNVWYATNLEIFNYLSAIHRLEYSVDEKTIFNPSSLSVWLMDDSTLIECKQGSATEL